MRIYADYMNSAISRYNSRYAINVNRHDVSFNGLNLERIFSRQKSTVSQEKVLKDYTYQIASYLGSRFEEIAPKIKELDNEGRHFLEAVSRKYNDINFSRGGKLKEDPQLVFDIVESVKNPKNYHYSVVNNVPKNINYLSKIFSLAQDKKSMVFVLDFQNEFLRLRSANSQMLLDILQSPFKKQYIDHIDDFKSFIILNKDNPEAIKELDLLVQNNLYNRKVYDIRLDVKNTMDKSSIVNSRRILSNENLEKYYSEEGIDFLNKFFNEYYSCRKAQLSPEREIDILDMYKTSNRHNIVSRLNLMNKFLYILQNNAESTDADIIAMKKLFELIDSDKDAMKFVNKAITTDSVQFNSIQQLYEILTELTPKKANMFSDNVFHIVRRVEDENLIPTLKEQYNNPFFETPSSRYNQEQMVRYGFKEPEGALSRFKRKVMNRINEYRYARAEKRLQTSTVAENLESKAPTQEPVIVKPQAQQPAKPKQPKQEPEIKLQPHSEKTGAQVIEETSHEQPIITKPVVEETHIEEKTIKTSKNPFVWNTQKTLPLQSQRIGLPAPKAKPEITLPSIDDLLKSQDVLPIKLERVIAPQKDEAPIKLVNQVKESPKARKLRLMGEVNELITKKLSAKTVEKQGDIYGKNATKMRLKMLPEIFASIKETRQTDRAVGKLKSISANKDAVDLYRLINGSNRKYVKYLLEKRNIDGTRMFEVKDIIAMVEKANKRIDSMKKANPDFKTKDAKAYFDHLYDAKLEQYGKVKRSRKK